MKLKKKQCITITVNLLNGLQQKTLNVNVVTICYNYMRNSKLVKKVPLGTAVGRGHHLCNVLQKHPLLLLGTQIDPLDATKNHRHFTDLSSNGDVEVKTLCRFTVIKENISSPSKNRVERLGTLRHLLTTSPLTLHASHTQNKSSDINEPSPTEQAESWVACTLTSGKMSKSAMALVTKTWATMVRCFPRGVNGSLELSLPRTLSEVLKVFN